MSDDTLKTGNDAGQLFDSGLYCAESVLLALGRRRAGEAAGPAYQATQAFIDDFRTRFGSTNCADLLDGCDLGSPEGRQRFGAEKLIGRCRSYTATAADLAVQAIDKAKAG
jgi:hypothetical protein